MLLWQPDQLAVLDAAVADARVGIPTLLFVQGEPGTGKSSLLDRLAGDYGFQVLWAAGIERHGASYPLLEQLGVEPRPDEQGPTPTSFVAAQRLREALDRRAGAEPLLICVDDLQWADPESVEALVWLLRRAAGDRLLLAAASRPLPSDQHPALQRWAAGASRARRVDLSGLTFPHAVTLAEHVRPGLSRRRVELLWEHTSGNPLYLRALLTEYEPVDIDMRVLPAPAAFTSAVLARFGYLSTAGRAMAEAAAVLGKGSSAMPVVAAVAGIGEPRRVAQELAESGLIVVSDRDAVWTIRFVHPLVRGAVYQQLPLPRRLALHARAAEAVLAESDRLEHRLMAVDRHDDELAAEVEQYALRQYDVRSYRVAARFLRASASITTSSSARERRWLDGLFTSLLDFDFDPVEEELATVRDASDRLRSGLITGALSLFRGRWREAEQELGALLTQPSTAADATTRYRIGMLLAWARMGSGAPALGIRDAIDGAEALGVSDTGVAAYGLFAGGQASGRLAGCEALLDGLDGLPSEPASFPVEQAYLLVWRGALRLHLGLIDEALPDLQEGCTQIQAGLVDIGDGGFPGVVGQTCWLAGRWDVARIYFRLTREVSGTDILPLALAYLVLESVSSGDFGEADRQIAHASQVLQSLPWQESVQALLVSRTARLHAGGSPQERAALLPDMRSRWPRVSLDAGFVGAMEWLHVGLAAVWAGELAYAERLTVMMEASARLPSWVPGACAWLRGLAAEAAGDQARALELMQTAVARSTSEMPLYRAHIVADLARLAERNGATDEAAQSYRQALREYEALGATPYVERLRRIVGSSPDRGPSYNLTEREHGVLALVTAGLSYAQIAAHLFITQSTVSFHLGRIYAKIGVRSRHQLVELVRADPAAFGISTAG